MALVLPWALAAAAPIGFLLLLFLCAFCPRYVPSRGGFARTQHPIGVVPCFLARPWCVPKGSHGDIGVTISFLQGERPLLYPEHRERHRELRAGESGVAERGGLCSVSPSPSCPRVPTANVPIPVTVGPHCRAPVTTRPCGDGRTRGQTGCAPPPPPIPHPDDRIFSSPKTRRRRVSPRLSLGTALSHGLGQPPSVGSGNGPESPPPPKYKPKARGGRGDSPRGVGGSRGGGGH